MPHMSYRSALAHALDDLLHWAFMGSRADDKLDELLRDVNRYRQRLGLPELERVPGRGTVDEVARADSIEADKLMHSVLTAVHDYQVRTHRPFMGTIYLAPNDWDRIVAATKIITNPEMCDPDDPANYRYADPATSERTGTLFGCGAESSPDIPEGKFVLGEIHTAAP